MSAIRVRLESEHYEVITTADARKLNAFGVVTKTDWMGEGMKNVTSALRLCARFRGR